MLLIADCGESDMRKYTIEIFSFCSYCVQYGHALYGYACNVRSQIGVIVF